MKCTTVALSEDLLLGNSVNPN